MDIREINVVGAGSLGSFTVQLLAKMAPNWQCPITVWDFDKVENHNVNNQLYTEEGVGNLKVSALSGIISRLGGPEIRTVCSAVDETTDLRDLVIVAVDSMAARKKIMDICRFNWGVDYLIEARMGGHLGRVFALDPKNPESVKIYSQYLYDDKDAANPICTTNETIPALWTVAASVVQLVFLYRKAIILENTFIEGTINLTEIPIVNFNAYNII